jgi:hypothetical protein
MASPLDGGRPRKSMARGGNGRTMCTMSLPQSQRWSRRSFAERLLQTVLHTVVASGQCGIALTEGRAPARRRRERTRYGSTAAMDLVVPRRLSGRKQELSRTCHDIGGSTGMVNLWTQRVSIRQLLKRLRRRGRVCWRYYLVDRALALAWHAAWSSHQPECDLQFGSSIGTAFP